MIIKQNTRKVLFLLLIGLFFIIGGAFMLGYVIIHYGDTSTHTIKLLRYKNFSIIVLILGLTLSVLITLIYTLRLIKATPILMISKDGVTDYSTIASIGFIAWDDIKNISILTLGQQPFIMITPVNIKKITSKLPKHKRIIISTTISIGFPPIAINLNSTKEKPQEIMTAMNKYWDEWKKNNKQEKV